MKLKKLKTYPILAIAFILFGLYLFIPERQENLIPIVLIVASLMFFLQNRKEGYRIKPLIISSAIYFVLVLSLMYSDDLKYGFKKLESMSSLIVFPIIFFVFLSSLKKTKVVYLINLFNAIFFISNTLFCVFFWYYSLSYRNPKFPFNNSEFYRKVLVDLPLVGEHTIYASLLVSMSILTGFFFIRKPIFKKPNIYVNLLLIISMLIMIGFIFLLMSKGVIIGLILALFLLLFLKYKRYKLFLIAPIILIVLGGVFLPRNYNRFTEIFKKETYIMPTQNSSTSIRMGILRCDLNLIMEAPIMGYGLGDVQNELDKCYFKESNHHLLIGKNSHNQYFNIWLATGIIGLIVFVYTLIFYLKIAINNKDYLFLAYIILFGVVFLFENVLIRQTGVIIFAFAMNSLVLKNSFKQADKV